MAAPTPTGAKYMTMLVNLNIVSDRLSQKASIGRRRASLMVASAMLNSTLKTTICSTSPSATDRATFSGKTWSSTSEADCLRPVTSAEGRADGGWTPTPARVRLMAASPMKSAMVVTASK